VWVMMIAISSPVWQMKPSINRPLQIAFATSPSTVAIMREDGFVWPTDRANVSLDDRKSELHEHSSPRTVSASASALAAPGARRCSFPETSVAAIGSKHPVHPVCRDHAEFLL
jgi:hypothetical protein